MNTQRQNSSRFKSVKKDNKISVSPTRVNINKRGYHLSLIKKNNKLNQLREKDSSESFFEQFQIVTKDSMNSKTLDNFNIKLNQRSVNLQQTKMTQKSFDSSLRSKSDEKSK